MSTNDPTDPRRDERPWETEMSHTFDRRVRDLREAPLSFEQVTTRARGIRRRRQAAVAGGVLAVAAVVAPVAVVTLGDGPGRGDGVPAATSSRTPTVTDSAAPELPENGPTPMVGSIQGDNFVRGDGVVFDLPGTGYTRADQLGAEIVAFRRDDEGTGTIDVLTAPDDGGTAELVESLPAVDGYVTDPQGLVIAYRTPDGELVTRWDGGELSYGSDFPEAASPAAVTGGPSCEADGCAVYVNDGSGTEPPLVTTAPGTIGVAVPDGIKVLDVDAEGVASVQTSSSETGSCSGLYDTVGGAYLFDTCDNTLSTISPGGEHVLAGPAYLDGLMSAFTTILDRDGEAVAEVPDGGYVGSAAWEDPGHVVYTLYADGGWSIWRLGIDGEAEQLTDPVPGDEVDAPITFS